MSLSNSGQTAAPVQLLHGQCHEAVRGHGTETEARGEMEGQAGGCHWPRDPVQSRWRERERERERERLVRVEGGSCGWTGTRSRRPQEAELGTHGRGVHGLAPGRVAMVETIRIGGVMEAG